MPTWMDLEIIILIEVSQTEQGEYHMISFYVESKKIDTNKLIYRTETDSQTRKQTYSYQRGKVGRREKLEIWEEHIHTTIYKIDKQQGSTV